MRAAPTRRALGLVAASAAACVAAACTARARAGVDSRAAGTAAGPPTGSDTAASGAADGGPVTASAPGTRGDPDNDPDWVRVENRRRGTPGWDLASSQVAGPTQLAGYASRSSVIPGQECTLFVSAAARSFRVRAFRLGCYGGLGARRVWSSPRIRGRRQRAPRIDAHDTVTCAWDPSVTVSTTGWLPGTYLLLLTDDTGRGTYVPLTVLSRTITARLVVLNAVPTYQAYNQWGGYSLYKGPDGAFDTRASTVSYDRPYDENGAPITTQYEQAIIKSAERLGLPLAYLTSLQLDADPHALDGARGVVSLGHDEYWTTGMRAAVTGARDRGTNVAFLGANAVYWRVRLGAHVGAEARTVICYKSGTADPVQGPTTTTYWRAAPHPDPEHSLVGTLYEDFPASGPLVVHDPEFFLFRGSGARRGSSYPGLIGTEINRAYPIPGTPENLRVVAHSPVVGPVGPTCADMVYYTVPSGAAVFSVGTMAWNKAVRSPSTRTGTTAASVAFARTVTDNLLIAMAAGPMGHAHPAVGNLAELHESPGTSTGTGGPVDATTVDASTS